MLRRAYDNSLRAEQAEQTRQRILDAVVAIVGEDGDVATAAIAKRAGVSEPTVYRHFPNREALIAGVSEHASARLGAPPVPQVPAELPAGAVAMTLYMGRNREWIRAGIRNPEFREMRMHGRRRRLVELRRLLEPALAHLPRGDRDVAFAAFAIIQRGETWDELVSTHGLSDEDAGRALAFILEACQEKLARQARAKVSSLVDEATVQRGRELDASAVRRTEGRE